MPNKITTKLDDTDLFIQEITKNDSEEKNSEYEELSLTVNDTNIVDEPQKCLRPFELANDIECGGSYIEEYFKENKSMPPEYSQFLLNNIFASSSFTILIANEMNKWWNIPNECHYSFIKNVIEKRKKPYRKYIKDVKTNEDINLLAKYFHMSVKEMYKNLSALSDEYKKELLDSLKKDQENKGKITKTRSKK